MKPRKRIISFLMFILMVLASTTNHIMAKEDLIEKPIVDENVATVVAALFVQANINDGMWDLETHIERVIPMFGASNHVAAYCIVFSSDDKPAGYVIVSTNLYDQMIVEFSPEGDCLTDYLSKEKIELMETKEPVYFSGGLQYSLNHLIVEEEIEVELTDEMQQIREHNEQMLLDISPLVLYLTSGYITNPDYFLQTNFPGYTFGLSDHAETSYVLLYAMPTDGSMTNTCVVYATAAILKYYLGSSYWFSTIVNNCLSIAQTVGYAPNASSGNYYIPLGAAQPFVQACIDSHGLYKSALSLIGLTWTLGTAEINANRPFILQISTSSSYSDHAVTAIGYRLYIDTGANYYKFFKVNDGYSEATSRWVYFNTCISFMTRIN